MAQEVKWRRGNASQTANFVGADGEITINQTKRSIHVHDGITSGGFEQARSDLSNVENSAFAAKAVAAGVGGGGGEGGSVISGAEPNASYITVNTEGSLPNERRLQGTSGIAITDGGAGGAITVGVNFSDVSPQNLGSANPGSSVLASRADHTHAMPTATQVGAVPVARTVTAGLGLSGGGNLSSNITLALSAGLANLTDVFISNAANNDLLVYNGATSRFENFPFNTLGQLTVQSQGVVTGTSNGITTINFVGNGVSAAAQSGNNKQINVQIDKAFSQEEIEDIIGGMVTGNTETGISVTYDDPNGKLNFATNNFNVSLSGVVQGVGTVTNLQNVTINTTMTPNGVALGTDTTGNYISTISAGANGITVTGSGTETAAVTVGFNLTDGNFIEAIQDIVGGMVTANTESGLDVTYDDTSGKLNFDVADWTISASGAMTGSAVVTNNGNTTIPLTPAANSITLGSHTVGNYIATLAPVGTSNGIFVNGSGTESAAATIGLDVSDANFVEGIQDIVGTMITNGVKNGMTVLYNDNGNRVDFTANSFTMTLAGAMTGSATVNSLTNTTITTTMAADAVILGTHTAGNYVATVAPASTANGIVVAGSGQEGAGVTVGLDMSDANFAEGIQDIIGGMVTGNVESGISVTYNDNGLGTGKLNFDVNDFTLSIAGAVSGSAVVSDLANATITVSMAADSVALGTHTSGNYVQSVAAASPSNGIQVTGSGEGASVQVGFDLNDANFVEGIQDVVGAMVSSNIESGIAVTYNDANGKLNFDVNDVTLTLAGMVTGSATIADLSSTTITTTIAADAVILGVHTSGNYVSGVSAGANGIVVSGSGAENATATVGLDLSASTFVEGIQDIVGGMVTGSTQSGIGVTYDDVSAKLNFDVNDFTITLTGPVTGTGTVTNLGNLSFSTSVANDAIALGTHTTGNYVATVQAGANGIVVSGTGEGATATVGLDLSNSNFVEGVQDAVGAMFAGNTENGLSVVYDDASNKINLQVNNPVITVAGAVSGQATVTNLGDTTITVSHVADSIALGTHTTGNYVSTISNATTSNGIVVVNGVGESANPTVNLNMADSNFIEGIQDIIGTAITNGTKSGLSVVYNDAANRIDFDVNDPIITLAGAVTGSATMTNLSNTTITASLANDSVTLGTHTTGNYIATVAPATTSNGITVTGSGSENAAARIGLNLADTNFVEGIQDIIGGMVTGNVETNVDVTYDDTNGKLNFAISASNLNADLLDDMNSDVNANATTIVARDGAGGIAATTAMMTGSAPRLHLYKASGPALDSKRWEIGMTDTTWYLSAANDSWASLSNAFVLTRSGTTITRGDITATNGLFINNSATLTSANIGSFSAVQEVVEDWVGGMVSGNTESGISVTYSDGDGKLNFDVNDFTLTANGAMTGAVTITNLGSATLSLTPAADSIALGTHTTGNYIASIAPAGTSFGISVTTTGTEGASVSLALNPADSNFVESIQDIVGAMVSSNTETGIDVSYDDPSGKLNFSIAQGSGSGLNADQLDGLESTAFVLANGSRTITGTQNIQIGTATTQNDYLILRPTDHGTSKPYFAIQKSTTANRWTLGLWDGTNNNGTIDILASSFTVGGNLVWNQSNDGAGSGLDADLLDGYNTALTASANTIAVRDGAGDITANLFKGTATSARYADVAERYSADAEYDPGTVVVFGGNAEVTACGADDDYRMAGVISTAPALMMNSDAGDDKTHPFVALVGRVPCKVVGPVKKGDLLTTSVTAGHAKSTKKPVLGSIIGKALDDFDGDVGIIEIAVQRF